MMSVSHARFDLSVGYTKHGRCGELLVHHHACIPAEDARWGIFANTTKSTEIHPEDTFLKFVDVNRGEKKQ
jgi:hypothetical protein